MSDAFVGEIRMFAGAKAPSGWHFCDGTVLPINSNEVLFVLIGKTFGGDGVTTFALPDLRSRVPVGAGSGPGLTLRALAQTGGQEQVTLSLDEIPLHSHSLVANPAVATLGAPGNAVFATSASSTSTVEQHYLKAGSTISNTWVLNTNAVGTVGAGSAHENRMACVGMNFMICLNGIFPDFN